MVATLVLSLTITLSSVALEKDWYIDQFDWVAHALLTNFIPTGVDCETVDFHESEWPQGSLLQSEYYLASGFDFIFINPEPCPSSGEIGVLGEKTFANGSMAYLQLDSVRDHYPLAITLPKDLQAVRFLMEVTNGPMAFAAYDDVRNLVDVRVAFPSEEHPNTSHALQEVTLGGTGLGRVAEVLIFSVGGYMSPLGNEVLFGAWGESTRIYQIDACDGF